MAHTARQHPAQLCHLCGSQSPVFARRSHVAAHLRDSHGVETHFSCPNCPNQAFPDIHAWLTHLKNQHKLSNKEALRPVKRKRSPKQSREAALSKLNPVCGLRNDSHRHCHILGVLHLLAQTSMPAILDNRPAPDSDLKHSLRHLWQFFDQYKRASAPFFPHQIIQNPSSFGVDRFPDRPGDLIRLFVDCLLSKEADCEETFKTLLEWRFECQDCKRFTRTRTRECLLRIDAATEAASFEEMLDKFLMRRRCICGATCISEPLTTSAGGDFLFIEVDRSSSKKSPPGSGKEELSLFPLKIVRTRYKILGSDYKVFATINLNLDYAEGGHYSTNVFVGDADELLSLHEDHSDLHTASPSFDSTAMVVALRKDQKDRGPVETGEGSDPCSNLGQGSNSSIQIGLWPHLQIKLKIL